MKPTRLILIPSLGNEPAPYLVIADGRVRERGLLEPDAVERPEPMRTVAVVPGVDTTIRWLDLPPGSQVQQRAAALWMLKDATAVPADRLAVALGAAPSAGRPRLVAIVGLSLLQAWVDYLDALGVRADAIVPDVMTVPEPEEDDRLNAVAFGPAMALRGRGFAASVQSDLVALVAGSRRVEPITDPTAVEQSLIAASLAPPIDLLSAQDRTRGTVRRDWTRAAALAGLLLVSPLVLVAAAAARDEAAARADVRSTYAEIARVAPELTAQPGSIEALRRRVRAAPPPGGVIGATAALFAAIEGIDGAELGLLTIDPEAGMKASITHTDYQDIRTMGRGMSASGLHITETSTLDDGGRIVSDVTIGSIR